MSTLDFWFDPASTYSYLSAMRIEPAAKAAGVDMRWRPFLLGPIFKAQGWDNSPFNLFPAKGRHMWRDMERQARLMGIPLRVPDETAMAGFPRNSLLAARTALVALNEPWGRDFVRAVYKAEFGEWKDIADAQVIAEILTALGQDARAILEKAQSDGNKARLRANTEEAAALGIFGAPSFTIGKELFWGNDRLDQAIAFARDGEA
jgi:2-hydroxychromene-2-carboxylate isomerase